MLSSVFSEDTNIRAWMGNYSFRKIYKEQINKRQVKQLVQNYSIYQTRCFVKIVVPFAMCKFVSSQPRHYAHLEPWTSLNCSHHPVHAPVHIYAHHPVLAYLQRHRELSKTKPLIGRRIKNNLMCTSNWRKNNSKKKNKEQKKTSKKSEN